MGECSDSTLFGLFDQAMDLEEKEREAFLTSLAADDATLAEKIRDLVARFDQHKSLFEEPLVPRFINVFRDTQDETEHFEGRRVGPYKLTRPLGQGGMGSVWLGTRDDGAHQRDVAIKLLTRIHVKDFRHRFQKEQQILAGLQHPYIGSLYDSGVTDDGVPFYIMPHVIGERLDVYICMKNPDLNARLRLFQKICEAVNYAHQNLVVHRDLKPQNILVNDNDEPVLLDFGIAKVMEADGHQTETGLRPMTREYASPEQIMGKPVNVSSDIYSLGVILYELLTGLRPHNSNSSAPFDLERKILEEEPTRPSEMITGDKANPHNQSVIANGTDQNHYRRALSGELDAIVLMALQKEPGERYSSAQQFSEDIEAYLTNMPIRARRATALVLALKFVRRNVLAVVASIFMFAFLVVMLVITFHQKNKAEKAQMIAEETRKQVEVERDLANQARAAEERTRKVAETERDKALLVSSTMLEFLNFSDPFLNEGEKISISDFLRHGENQIRKLQNQPEIQTTLMLAMARLYYKAGNLSRGRALAEKCLDQRVRAYGEGSLEVAKVKSILGDFAYQKEDFKTAEILYEQALNIVKGTEKAPENQLAEAILKVGAVEMERGNLDTAHQMVSNSLEILQRINGSPGNIIHAYAYLGFIAQDRGDSSQAIHYFKEAKTTSARYNGEEHPQTTLYDFFTGRVYYLKRDFDRAEMHFLRVIDRFDKILRYDHRYYAEARHSLFNLYRSSGQTDKAMALFEKHKGHIEDSSIRFEVAKQYIFDGRFYEGLQLFEELMQVFMDENLPYYAAYTSLLMSRTYFTLGDFVLANYYADHYNAYDPTATGGLFFLYHALKINASIELGRLSDARDHICVLEEHNLQRSDSQPLTRAYIAAYEALIHLTEGNLALAAESIELSKSIVTKNHFRANLPWVLKHEARIYLACGSPQKTISAAAKAFELMEESNGVSLDTAYLHMLMAQAYSKIGQKGNALTSVEKGQTLIDGIFFEAKDYFSAYELNIAQSLKSLQFSAIKR